jgi:hypothetical protein
MKSWKKAPSFVSGYGDDGQPIYTPIRMVRPEVVDRIEAEAARSEKEYLLNQQSDTLL